MFAFLAGKIKLYQIYEITKKIYDGHEAVKNPSVDEIFEVDEAVREKTRQYINKLI